MNKPIQVIAGLIVAHLSCQAMAQGQFIADWTQDKEISLMFSPYTKHVSHNPDHKRVVMIGVERLHKNDKVDGMTFFSNSFGQETVYIYPWGGVYRSIFGIENLSFKWTGGLLYGYKKPYEDKVPLNYKGFSPAIIPALVYQFNPTWSAQVNVLGTAGIMLQVSARLK